MRYASLREPTLLPVAQRVLAIPVKRFDRPVLGYLSREEITAIIDAPDRATWSGQRDAVLFAVLYNTGARVSEITRQHVADVLLDRASSLLLHGKGRKERVVPLWKSTAAQLRRWFPRIDRSPDAPVFPNRAGKPLSRSGVEHQLRVACRKASDRHPSLANRLFCEVTKNWAGRPLDRLRDHPQIPAHHSHGDRTARSSAPGAQRPTRPVSRSPTRKCRSYASLPTAPCPNGTTPSNRCNENESYFCAGPYYPQQDTSSDADTRTE